MRLFLMGISLHNDIESIGGEKMVKQSIRNLLVFALLLCAFTIYIPQGHCAYSGELYPEQGDVFTEVYLQVRGTAGEGELYLFWDDIFLGMFTQSDLGYDVFFYPPNQHPYSDLGNHTVFFEIWFWYWDGQMYYKYWNHSIPFEIIERQPCDAWLTLNATYTSLLANYSDLLSDYNSLLVDHSTLQASYNNLQNNYNSLLSDYSNLLSSYNTLASNYDSLSSNYYELESSY